jgi:hypothetical protein
MHDKIRVFSINDDVLDLIHNGSNGASSRNLRTTLFCSESGAISRKVEANVSYAWDRRLSCKIVYQKAGIYFSLQAKVQSQNFFSGIWWAQQDALSLRYIASFKPKCRDGEYKEGIVYNDPGTSELNYRAYESTRGLHNYYYSALFANNVIQVGWLTIQD